ncbi:hypothetical protein EIP86_010705 [Pleurotus ostreatoroseus]|nr:hypothetical protein EIP86_010705 [Pleurotus ostreatoroseus]
MSKRPLPDPSDPPNGRHPRVRTEPSAPSAAPAVPQAHDRAVTEPRSQQPTAARNISAGQNKGANNGATYKNPFDSVPAAPAGRALPQVPSRPGFQRAATQGLGRGKPATIAPLGARPSLPVGSSIPKIVPQTVNDVKELKEGLAAMKKTVNGHDQQIAKMELSLESLQTHADEAAREIQELQSAVHHLYSLYESLAAANEAGEAAAANFAADEGAEGGAENEKPVKKKKRNSPLSAALNIIFRDAVKIKKGSTPPHPPEDGSCWEKLSETEIYLRPQWYLTWTQNAEMWSDEIVKRFRDRGWKVSADMSREDVEKTEDHQILTALAQIYDNHTRKYKKTYGDNPPDLELIAQQNRRRERKRAKAKERAAVWHLLPRRLRRKKYACLFQAGYMSTDVSDYVADTTIDPATEDEAVSAPNAHAAKTRAAAANEKENQAHATNQWTSCSPTYRKPVINEIFGDCDHHIEEKRAKQPKRQGNSKHTKRVRGPPKDTALPNPANYKKFQKISKDLLDEEWLTAHSEFDSPQFYAPPSSEEDPASAAEGVAPPGPEPAAQTFVDQGEGEIPAEEEEIPIDPALLAEDRARRRHENGWDGDYEDNSDP